MLSGGGMNQPTISQILSFFAKQKKKFPQNGRRKKKHNQQASFIIWRRARFPIFFPSLSLSFCTADKCSIPTNNALLINFRLSSDAEIFANNHRLSITSRCQTCKKRVCNVYKIPTELPFCTPPLVVGMERRNKNGPLVARQVGLGWTKADIEFHCDVQEKEEEEGRKKGLFFIVPKIHKHPIMQICLSKKSLPLSLSLSGTSLRIFHQPIANKQALARPDSRHGKFVTVFHQLQGKKVKSYYEVHIKELSCLKYVRYVPTGER